SLQRENYLLLAGRSWRVRHIDEANLVLVVEPSTRVAVPKWHSLGPGPSFEVMQRAFAIICGQTGVLETPPLTKLLAAEREDAQVRGYEAGTIAIEDIAQEVSLVTYFGSTLNQYLSMLLLGEVQLDRVRSTPSMIRVQGASAEEIGDRLRFLLVDPNRRRTALEAALPNIAAVSVGRFWPMFGPKTRSNVLRRFFRNAEPYIERIAEMAVVRR
ncbi:MAG: hypothetical protein JO092_07865, partial [Candidatus Eremiobacteraeota bacterium]|nr:hypothetical protein [Candidatus Eremiobacteraeota bacterium]